MKNYITVAALLAAGTAFANAGVITIAENFFGSSDTTQTAEFRGGEWGKPFNGNWTAGSDGSGGVFGAGTTDFSVVYQYGLNGGDADWSAGTLYYGTANNGAMHDPGNRPSLTVSGGSASITGVAVTTGQGATVAVIRNTISAEELKSVTDLSLSFKVGSDPVDVAVFYLASGGGAYDVKRLGLGNYSAAGTYSLDFDYSAIDASKDGTFVVAVRNVGTTWTYGSASDLTWSGTSAIPEPSAFGLLAGLGALALVASRRRRK